MDIVSHGLWGGIAFGRSNKKSFRLSFLFGIAPDLLSFGPFFAAVFMGLAKRPQFFPEPPDPSLIPSYVHNLYSFTHSLAVFAVAFVLLWVILRKPIWESLAWGFHIILDIFTHSYQFFPTPFLWPISEFEVNGWPWTSPKIFFPNIAVLVILYVWFFIHKRGTRIKADAPNKQ